MLVLIKVDIGKLSNEYTLSIIHAVVRVRKVSNRMNPGICTLYGFPALNILLPFEMTNIVEITEGINLASSSIYQGVF